MVNKRHAATHAHQGARQAYYGDATVCVMPAAGAKCVYWAWLLRPYASHAQVYGKLQVTHLNTAWLIDGDIGTDLKSFG